VKTEKQVVWALSHCKYCLSPQKFTGLPHWYYLW